jgi:hypothetical protein
VRPYLEKPFSKTGLVEWLKVKALSSSPSTAKKKKAANNSVQNSGFPGSHSNRSTSNQQPLIMKDF